VAQRNGQILGIAVNPQVAEQTRKFFS
jgi:hypothetical protein